MLVLGLGLCLLLTALLLVMVMDMLGALSHIWEYVRPRNPIPRGSG